MCGIAGIVDLKGRGEVSPTRLKAMTDAIARRGPDGEGRWFAPGVGLGHRRLAIIDPEGGEQPFVSADGRVALVFNGMIYNFRALRTELEAAGAVFVTDCDTEVLLHGWRIWGESIVDRLDGFFAAAIWDEDRESLFLLRDRWGKKPFYYTRTSAGEVLFGSDLDAVLAGLDGVPPIRRDALADYLSLGYVPEPKSIFEGIDKLPPAHVLRLDRGGEMREPQKYWTIRVHPQGNCTLDAAVEQLTPLLRSAVRKRLVADVPLGTFLSGGVDSAAMLAIASDIRGPRLDACTMGFDDPALDETGLAAEVARLHGARHHVERVTADAMADLDGLGSAFSEPFADASALPTLHLCAMASRHVKVALSGDGGDELFAGYRRYPYHLAEENLKARMPGWAGRGLFGPLARAYPAMPNGPRILRAKSTFESLATDAMGGLFRATAILREKDRDRLLGSDARIDAYSTADLLRVHALQANTDDPLARAQYVDLMTWLPGRMLVKVDRASMATGVEVRNPLLDIDLANWAARLPTDLKLDGFSGKRVLKAALRAQVPDTILDAKKRGFVAPIGDWMTGRFAAEMERLTEGSILLESGLVERDALRSLWGDLKTGRADTSRALWTVLMLDRFVSKIDDSARLDRAA